MAHPDDSEILAGGTLIQLREREWGVGLVTMTAGDIGSISHTKQEIIRIRYEEAQNAVERLDGWYRCVGLADMEIFANKGNLRRLVELIRRFRPDLVITHSPVDYLVDHEETARLVRSATFAAGAPLYETHEVPPAEPLANTPALYYADPFEGIDPMGQRVEPQFYVDISEHIDGKTEMLKCHASQREWLKEQHGVDKYIKEMKLYARDYGKECGVGYAEGYRQHRSHGYTGDPILQEALGSCIHHN